MTPTFRAAVVQLCATTDVDTNLATTRDLVRRGATQGAELVVVPENFCLIGGLRRKVAIAEELTADDPGPILGTMMALARELRIHLLVGSMPTRGPDPEHCYNTSILLDGDGQICAIYRKIHLFDIDIPGGATFKESEFVSAGEEVVTVSLGPTTMGLSICYDLRFPELYRQLVEKGAEIICVPAAFTLHTGKDHWLPLLRARAIENQTYVLAANQWGAHNETRSSYGKSCIIDPWGAIIAQVSDSDGVAVADLDLAYLRRVRDQLPALTHRRL